MRKFASGSRGLLLFLFFLLPRPSLAQTFEGRLLLPDGTPAAGYEVSVVGLTLTVTTNPEGRFRIIPTPPLPFHLVATSPTGEVSPLIEVPALPETGPADLSIAPAFRDSVTVAVGVAPGLEAPPAAGTVALSQENLEQRKPPRLSDALMGIAGVSRTDETSTGVPVLRGLGRGRTLVLLDGSRVTTERRAGASASYLDPFTLGSVEVARGPGSVAYGSDAFGGVVHARPRYPEPGSPTLNFQIDKGFGAENEEAAGLEISRDALGGALQGLFTWRSSDDQEAGGGETIPNSAYEDGSGAIRYTTHLGNGRLRAGLFAADSDDVGKPSSDVDTVRTYYPEEKARRFNLAYESGPVGGWETLEMGLFAGTYGLVTNRDRVATSTAERLIESSDIDANDGSLRALATRGALGGRLLVGAEVVSRFGLEAITRRETLDDEGQRTSFEEQVSIDEASQLTTALFASFDWALASRTMVSIGLRGDRVETENEGGFFGDHSTSHSALSGHASLSVGPFRDVTTTLQVARGFRDPLLSDRYFQGPTGRGFVTGNPDLDPETSLQYDASVRWAKSGHSVALYGYLYQIEDLIERYRPARDFFFRNRGEAEVRGVELEATAALPAGFSLEMAAAWAEGEAENGDPLDDIATPNISSSLRWGGELGFAYVRGTAFQHDDEPGPTEVERPGVTVWEAGAGWRVLEPLEVRVVGRNLTDRRYYDGGDEVASLARGRSFSVGLVGRY